MWANPHSSHLLKKSLCKTVFFCVVLLLYSVALVTVWWTSIEIIQQFRIFWSMSSNKIIFDALEQHFLTSRNFELIAFLLRKLFFWNDTDAVENKRSKWH